MAGKTKIHDAFFERLGHSPEVTALCVSVAEHGAAIARSTAPVDTGEYRDGIHVVVKRSARRNVVLIASDDPKTMFIESETGNLARALGALKSGG